jgi:serine/threonine protein kinase
LLLAERLELFHYDLQPENILLKNVALPTDDSVVLIDLFIPLDRTTARSDGKATKVSAYHSPEQRAGREPTSSSHVYSLGVLLFQLLAGSLPSRPVSLVDTLMQRLFGRPTSLARARPGLSEETYRLVDRCLRRDGGQRFSEMEDFTMALDIALQAEESMVGSTVDGTTSPVRKSWRFFLPILFVLLFFMAGTIAIRRLDAWPVFPNSTTNGIVPLSTRNPGVVVPVNSPVPEDAYPEPEPESSTGSIVLITETSTLTPQPTDPTPSVSPNPTSTASITPTETPHPTETPTPTEIPEPVARVAFNSVNLRQGPGIVFPTIRALSRGEELIIVAQYDGIENIWLLVDTEDGRRGWISSTVVEIDNELVLADIPMAATYPPPPTATITPTVTPTSTPAILTLTPTVSSDGGGLPEPTTRPPQPPAEPTLTPPPLP